MNAVDILQPIQPVHDDTARVGGGRRRPVQRGLETDDERLGHFRLRTRAPGRWHLSRPELPHDLFQDVGIGAHLCEVERLKAETAGLQFLVVAGHAELIDERPVDGRGFRLRLRSRLEPWFRDRRLFGVESGDADRRRASQRDENP